nr:hypothetical protein [Gammaproteobacteria bacterium]
MERIRDLLETTPAAQMVAGPPTRTVRRYKVTLRAEVGRGSFLTFETNVNARGRDEALQVGRELFNATLKRYHTVGHEMKYLDAVLINKE